MFRKFMTRCCAQMDLSLCSAVRALFALRQLVLPLPSSSTRHFKVQSPYEGQEHVIPHSVPLPEFRVVVASSRIERATGLLNHADLGRDLGLLLLRTRHIHTHGMNFAITALYLDKELRILSIQILVPNMVDSGPAGTHAVLEIASSHAGVARSWIGCRLVCCPGKSPPLGSLESLA